MTKIISGRGTGKTQKLLLLAQENDGVVVCLSPKAMKEKAYNYGIMGVAYMSYEDFSFDYYFDCPVYIDDVDAFLSFKNKDIKGFSLSED